MNSVGFQNDEELMQNSEDLSKTISDLTLSTSSMAFSEVHQNMKFSAIDTSPMKKGEEIPKAMKCLCCKTEMEFVRELVKKDMHLFECRGCGMIEGADVTGALICPNCNFKLCKSCRFCPNGHFLKRVYNLVIPGQPYFFNPYTNNKAVCSLCNNIIEIKTGLFHCWPCTYNVCLSCIRFSKGKMIERNYFEE